MRAPILASWARRRLALGGLILAAGLVIVGLAVSVSRPNGNADAIGGPFALTDGDGRPVTDRTFRGRYMLIYFGYTTCPDVCPTTLSSVAEALESLGPKADRIQPIFVTIDPARDTPAVVKAYAHQFSSRLVGLTGSPEAIAKAAMAYRVYYAPHRTGPGPDDYTMDHSSVLYLVGPSGQFITPIGAENSAARMAAELDKEVT